MSVFLLGAHGFPSNAVATELGSGDRQAAETIDDGEGTILVPESFLDVVRRRWVRVFWEVDFTVGVGGCCQDARRDARQAEVTLEQCPSLEDKEEDGSETRRELILIPSERSDCIHLQWTRRK